MVNATNHFCNTADSHLPVSFQSNQNTQSKCFRCGGYGHWRAECPFQDFSSVINALRRRMRDVNGTLNEAAAKVLFEIAYEHDKQYGNDTNMEENNTFKNLDGAHNDANTRSLEDIGGITDISEPVADKTMDCIERWRTTVTFFHTTSGNYTLPSGTFRRSQRKTYFYPSFTPHIHVVALMQTSLMSMPSPNYFYGTTCDTDAQKTFFDVKRACAFCEMVGQRLKLSPASAKFVFGDRFCKSLGIMNFLLHTTIDQSLSPAHVLSITTPLLLGLNMLNKLKRNVLTVENIISSVSEGWPLRLV